MNISETICAPATIPGTGAISVVRLSGSDAVAIVDRVLRFRKGRAYEFRGGSVHFAEVPDGDSVLDEVLASFFLAPHSYTGEDCVEISCHASSYIVSRLLELLCEAGARMAEPGEFTRRAFLSGKMDLSQAEAVADVIASNSKAALRVAMNQLKGVYSQKLRDLRDQLVELASLMELELDFSEEEVEFADRGRLRELLCLTREHVKGLVDSFRMGNAIRNGVPVAIVGEVNAGKSTLLNALVGHDRAIVSDVPGTTRDTVEESFVVGGVQLRFVDTAGLRETSDSVEQIGISRSLKALSEAEIVLCVFDASQGVARAKAFWDEISEKLDFDSQRVVLVWNKMDIPGAEYSPGFSGKSGCGTAVCRVSAAGAGSFGRGISELREVLEEICREIGSQREDATMVTNLRHLEALRSASSYLEAVSAGLDSLVPTDLLAEDMRAAIRELNSIFGDAHTIDTEVLLGSIFSRFCIGK